MGDYEHPIRHGVCLKDDPTKYNTKLGEKARDLGLLTGLRRRELGHLKVVTIFANKRCAVAFEPMWQILFVVSDTVRI